MEIVSRNLRRTPLPSAALERSEYARRDRDILWYLLRGSIWKAYTRRVDGVLPVIDNVIIFFAPDQN
jgi:hypothetical protein